MTHLEEGYGAPLEAKLDPQIYQSPAGGLLQLLSGIDDELCRLLLVGHNPGLQRIGQILSFPDDPLHDAVTEHFPTAALLLLELDVSRWQELGPGTATIADFIKPRDLERAAS